MRQIFFLNFWKNYLEKAARVKQGSWELLGVVSVLSVIQSPLNWADTVWPGLRCASFC